MESKLENKKKFNLIIKFCKLKIRSKSGINLNIMIV